MRLSISNFAVRNLNTFQLKFLKQTNIYFSSLNINKQGWNKNIDNNNKKKTYFYYYKNICIFYQDFCDGLSLCGEEGDGLREET